MRYLNFYINYIRCPVYARTGDKAFFEHKQQILPTDGAKLVHYFLENTLGTL